MTEDNFESKDLCSSIRCRIVVEVISDMKASRIHTFFLIESCRKGMEVAILRQDSQLLKKFAQCLGLLLSSVGVQMARVNFISWLYKKRCKSCHRSVIVDAIFNVLKNF